MIREIARRPGLLSTTVRAAAVLALAFAGRPLAAGTAVGATRNPEVTAPHGMVASAHALASQAGLELLRAGGNAVDAAAAAAFAVGVVEPNASGIGGEGMLVLYRADTREAVAVDFRSTAPATAAYAGKVPSNGHAAVAVPGTVAGLALAVEKYGTKSLAEVMAPAIRLARDGFVASPTLAGIVADSFEGISGNGPLASVFCPDGLPLEAGATVRNPELASTLEKIARGGPDVFYRGEIAEAIVAETAANGGFLSKSDFAGYRAILREPVRGTYRGVTVLSAPPPVGGTPVIEALQILDRFRIREGRPLAPETVHAVAESLKRAYADFHAFVADPGFVAVPLERLLSPAYAKRRAKEVDRNRMTAKVVAADAPREGPSTTSLVAADRHGNLVSLTQTISDFFGAKVMVAGTGILLNNEMKNFSARGVNTMAPGKRMRTLIAPTILLRGKKPFAVLGTPGGPRITSTTVLVVSNLVDHGMAVQEAIEAPRYFARDTEKDLAFEARVPAGTLEALGRLGYSFQEMKDYDLFFGGVQAIVIDRRTGNRIGGADPRRDGAVSGY